MSKNKYGARKVEIDGHTFDSAAEGRRYFELKMLLRAGEISDLRLQPVFPFRGRRGDVLFKYVADFRYLGKAQNAVIVEDVKGVKTPVYRLKKKLIEDQYSVKITEIQA